MGGRQPAAYTVRIREEDHEGKSRSALSVRDRIHRRHCNDGRIPCCLAYHDVGWEGEVRPQAASVNKISEGRHRDFPLKHTDVKVAISGFLSRVRSGLPASSWGPGLPERGSMRGCRILGGRTEGDRLLGLRHLGGPREQHALLHREQRRIHGAIHGRWS